MAPMHQLDRFHHEAVETFGLCNISHLLSRPCPGEQVFGALLEPIDCKEKLAAFIGSSLWLLDFEAVVGSGTEPQTR